MSTHFARLAPRRAASLLLVLFTIGVALVTPARSQTPLPGQPVAHPGDPYAGTAGELPLPSWFSPVPDAKTIPGSELDWDGRTPHPRRIRGDIAGNANLTPADGA